MIPLIRDGLKKIVKVLIVALVLAAILTFVLIRLDLNLVRAIRFPYIGQIDPPWSVFISSFVTIVLFGLVTAFLGGTIKSKAKSTKEKFLAADNNVQAIVIGMLFAIVAGLSVGLTDVFLYTLPFFLGFVVAGFVWISIGFFTYRHLEADRALGPWLAMLTLGTVLAAFLGLLTLGLDIQIRRYDFPGYAPLLVFLLSAAPSMYLVDRHGTGGGVIEVLLVKTGMAQAGQLQTFTVGVAMGALVAVGVGLLVGIYGAGFYPTVIVFAVVWALVAYGTIRWFGSSEASTVLVIDAVEDRTSNRNRELSVRNLSNDPVDLRNAKIRDTDNDLYRTNIQVVLGAGQTGKFDIPPGFSIEPSDEPSDPWEFGSKTDVPVIVTPQGEKYELRWAHEVGQQEGQQQQVGHGQGNPGIEDNPEK